MSDDLVKVGEYIRQRWKVVSIYIPFLVYYYFGSKGMSSLEYSCCSVLSTILLAFNLCPHHFLTLPFAIYIELKGFTISHFCFFKVLSCYPVLLYSVNINY